MRICSLNQVCKFDEHLPSLRIFHTYIAVKSYSKFIKERYNTFIDSDESVNDFIEGLKFIINFVRENKIKLHDYPKITMIKVFSISDSFEEAIYFIISFTCFSLEIK